jgi:hypothetical protein
MSRALMDYPNTNATENIQGLRTQFSSSNQRVKAKTGWRIQLTHKSTTGADGCFLWEIGPLGKLVETPS